MDNLKEFMKTHLNKKNVIIAVAVLFVLLMVIAVVNGASSNKKGDQTESTAADITSEGVSRITGSSATTSSLESAKAMLKVSGETNFDTIIVTGDQSIADALSGTYLAKVKGAPILILTASDDKDAVENSVNMVTSFVKDNLSENGSIIILGGTSAVSEDVETALSDLGEVTRIAEEDRYATNLSILNEAGAADVSTLLVCNGTQFADSISAASTGLPILLVGDELTYAQKIYISDHNFSEICVLGGTSAVSEDTFSTLQTYCSNVERIAGDSRYATSKAIADKFFTGSTTVCVTGGDSFAAGLAAGPVANLLDAPILLVTDGSDAEAKTFISDNKVTTIMGFATADELSDDTLNGLK